MNIRTHKEGRYFKAYLHEQCGVRIRPPAKGREALERYYGISPKRAAKIRADVDACLDAS